MFSMMERGNGLFGQMIAEDVGAEELRFDVFEPKINYSRDRLRRQLERLRADSVRDEQLLVASRLVGHSV